MMKRCILGKCVAILCFLATCVGVLAQTEKNVVYKVSVGDMQYTPKQKKQTVGTVLETVGKVLLEGKITEQHDNYAESVRASVVKGVGNVRRFHAVDGHFQNGEVDVSIPALCVDGTITNISTATEVRNPADKKSSSYDVYKAILSVTVNVKDAHDNHLVDSHIFNVTEYDCTWVKTTESALNAALALLSERVTKHYNKLFALSASIIEAGDTKKDKQKEVYIDLGASHGAVEGMKLTVYSIKSIAGKEAKKELGSIKISEVMGDDVSLCKVQNGGKNIKAALDEGLMVVVVSAN